MSTERATTRIHHGFDLIEEPILREAQVIVVVHICVCPRCGLKVIGLSVRSRGRG